MSISAPRKIRHTRQTEPQRRFWSSSAKFRLYVGGVGAGKTRAGCVEAFRQPKGSTGMVLAPTYPMLRDATLRTFLELADEAKILREFNKSEMRATLAGRRTVLFRSADKPDRLRGPNLGWFWMDEAAMSPLQVWLIMLGRLRERPGIGWATTTPRGKNWLYKTFVEGSESSTDYCYVKASSKTNTYLPPGFVDSLLNAYDENFASQEVEGEFLDDTFGQLVLDWWVDRLPGLERPKKPGGLKWLTCDLGEGGGRDSTVILVGDNFGILHGIESPWVGPAEAAFHMAELSRTWGVEHDRMVYDAGGGRGLDVKPYLEQHGIEDAIPHRGSNSGGKRFENKRTRMAWRLRQRLDPDRPKPIPELMYDPDRKPSVFDPPAPIVPNEVQPPFCLPPGDKPWWPLLEQEIKNLKWHHKGKVIALETKAQLQARLGRSPNVLDALLMRFSLDDEE